MRRAYLTGLALLAACGDDDGSNQNPCAADER
jgi:hypothetical protein